MNLKKGLNEIMELYNNLNFEIKDEGDDYITFTNGIRIDDFKGNITMETTIYNGGTLHMFLTFDEIEENLENLKAINKFNEGDSFYKLYIAHRNNKKFLEIHYVSKFSNEDILVDEFYYALDRLTSNRIVRKSIQDLTNITFSSKEKKRDAAIKKID